MNEQSMEFQRGQLAQAAWAAAAFGDKMLCAEFNRQVSNLAQQHINPIPDNVIREVAFVVYFAATGLEMTGYGRAK